MNTIMQQISELGLTELELLVVEAQHLLITRKQQARAEARREILRLADEAGITAAELADALRPKTNRVRGFIFVHPENPDLTWTGWGRQPGWILELVAAGVSLDSLRKEG